jgi:hypothetical protein
MGNTVLLMENHIPERGHPGMTTLKNAEQWNVP